MDPLRKRLLKEDKWSRIYETEREFVFYESKFQADGLSISVGELTSEWQSWSASERLCFAQAFNRKPEIRKEDEEVLEFLMRNEDEQIWASITIALPKHSNKKMILNFLLERLASGSEAKANSVHALGILGDPTAVPALRELHARLSLEIKAAGETEDPGPITELISCCQALVRLESSKDHEREIESFLTHSDKRVRGWAEYLLLELRGQI